MTTPRPAGQRISDRRVRTLRRRRRTVAIGAMLVLVAVVISVVALLASSGASKSTTTATKPTSHHGPSTLTAGGHQSSTTRHSGTSSAMPAIESGLLPWQLPAPLSREVAVSGVSPGTVHALGGLTTGSASTPNVVQLAVPAGTTTSGGALANPTHDAAGTILGSRVLVFGGGVLASVSTVQAYPVSANGGTAAGSVIGQLPQPRSDADAVTIGQTAYVVGGYDGTHPDPQVLATTNGSSFHVVGSLPIPVRYPAVTASGRMIYVFGGQAVGGAANAVDAIQRIDTGSGKVTVVGHLPQAILGASAFRLHGVMYVAGGSTGASDSGVIYAFDPTTRHALVAGHLIVPLSNSAVAIVADTAWLVGGETGTTPTATVQMLRPNLKFGTAGAPGAGSPYFGEKLLIADRGNNRMLVLDDTGAVIWTYPNPPSMPPPPGPGGFYFPDDTFFIHHGTAIISNQEENETIVQIAYPSGKLLWSYGHPAHPGSAPGYLHEPDDAYLLKNGDVTVADADNCRILFINPGGTIVNQIGTVGSCVHNPPTGVGGPNGDTPLADGNVLVSETRGSFISEYTPSGQLVWTVHLAIAYPSDPQQLGPDLYLTADYSDPGGFVEFNKAGQILYQYRATSGINRLNQPSLVEQLPSGVLMANDDYRDRMMAIDPTTQALVWNYGVPDHPGTAPGLLNTPDGFDILNADGSTPTHPTTG